MGNKLYKRVHCHDGYSVSIQAGKYKYSYPRDDHGPYIEVELGFPSSADPLLDGYAENYNAETFNDPTDTVYPYVPVGIVRDLIIKHGGATSGEVPPGVLMFMAEGMEYYYNNKRRTEE